MFGGIGAPELIIAGILWFPLLGAVAVWVSLRRRAKRFGYPSTRSYLRAAPRTDVEKRDAVNIALIGFAGLALAVLFKPFVLAAVIPLFYGGRKVLYASLGLGLVDDDTSRA